MGKGLHLVIVLAALSLTACGPPSLGPPIVPPLTAKEAEAIKQVQLAVQLSDDLGEKIWPGFHVAEVPILLFRPGKRSFLLMAPPHAVPPNAKPFSAAGIHIPAYALPSSQIHTSPRTPFSQDFPLGQLKAFLVRHDDASQPEAFFRLLVHERFHHLQHTQFAKRTYPEQCRYPYENTSHAALVRAEDILSSKILTLANDDGDSFETLFIEYLALRKQRLDSPDGAVAGELEDWEEVMEGTARYVEESYAAAAGWSSEEEATRTILNYLASFDPRSLQKWKYYRTGLALAMALDKLNLNQWKDYCSQDSCLLRFALKFLAARMAEVTQDNIDKHTNIPQDQQTIVQNRIAEYLASEKEVLEKWPTQGEFRFLLTLNAKGNGYYSARGVTFMLPDCSRMVSGVIAYVDRTFGLEIRNRSIRMQNKENKSVLEFYTDITSDIVIDGAPWNDRNSEINFQHSLTLKFDSFELNIAGCGTLVASPKSISITLNGLAGSSPCSQGAGPP